MIHSTSWLLEFRLCERVCVRINVDGLDSWVMVSGGCVEHKHIVILLLSFTTFHHGASLLLAKIISTLKAHFVRSCNRPLGGLCA